MARGAICRMRKGRTRAPRRQAEQEEFERAERAKIDASMARMLADMEAQQ